MHESSLGFNGAALSGIAGAVTLTAVHQVARAVTDDAPRMDVVGMRAIASGLRAAGQEPRNADALYPVALAGDLVCNSAYYAMVAAGRRPDVWMRGTLLGLGAGLGALLLPQRLGLGAPPRSDRTANQIMTVAWYLLGGLAAAATAHCLRDREPRHEYRATGRSESGSASSAAAAPWPERPWPPAAEARAAASLPE